jgi:hypothetical protein
VAVRASFVADFSSFTQAVEKAELQLKGFGSGAVQVQKQLDRFGDAFSGRKIFQEAQIAAKGIQELGGVLPSSPACQWWR